jgi:hypothetical protein
MTVAFRSQEVMLDLDLRMLNGRDLSSPLSERNVGSLALI